MILKKQDHDSEYSKRQECVELKNQGHPATHIAEALDRSREWVHKWLRRFDSNDPEWFKDRSRRPRSCNNGTTERIEKAVVMIRQELVHPIRKDLEYSFVGAIAIHQELDKRKIGPLPSLSTINRILNKHGLTHQKAKKRRSNSGVYYPALRAHYPNHRHELDLVTPRYISGYGRVISVNRIDAFSSQANLGVFLSKGTDTILDFLVEDWKRFGIPEYLQMDNEASFRGGMYHTRSFGKLIRFCLNFGVQIIFIPWKEPWRNPFIENFNGHFNRLLWHKRRFEDAEHLRRESKRFLLKHNDYQTYKKDRFSKRDALSHTVRFLPESFRFNPETELPVAQGKLHFVRLVRENGAIDVLNESFAVSRGLAFEYVWATIDTARQKILVYHQATRDQKRVLVKEQTYKLRESVYARIPIKNFCGLSAMS